MKKLRNIVIIFILGIMLLSLTACDSSKKENEKSTQSTLDYLSRDISTNKKSNLSDNTENDNLIDDLNEEIENEESDVNEETKNENSDVLEFLSNLKKLSSDQILLNAEKQMAEPNEGDTIAIMHIEGYGDVKIKFFEDVAPKACENFITHAKEGYYNGLTFHRVINEFMIQGGDPLGNGTGGESIWNEDFGEELDATILPYRGSLSMASRGTGTVSIGSQFFINQTHSSDKIIGELKGQGYTNLEEACNLYGGELFMLAVYYQYTTFGQVYEGMDIVDKIASVEVDKSDKPVQDVIISSIEITTYSK